MECDSIKSESMLDDINRMRDEKYRLEERLAVVRRERRSKEAASVAVLRKRAALSTLLAKREEQLKMIRHRVAQQQAQLKDLRTNIALKSAAIKQHRTEIDQLKQEDRENADKFDAELESVYAETKRQWEFYKPANLEQEIASTKEAQRRIKTDIQATVQETENAMAQLQVAGSQRGMAVDAATQQLIQSALAENDKAADAELQAVNQQCHQLSRQIQDLA